MTDEQKDALSRRRFIKNTGMVAGGVVGGSLLGGSLRVNSRQMRRHLSLQIKLKICITPGCSLVDKRISLY
ncbi:hypothetical protein JNUCC1_00263 [Lentibacillus sp. JNUCC-1]|uniref:twin-arginine translocation signal domain-containing protein n=1 Tax=Lentibacillus sp. JNUCC-1 TaxID=2654513 RepID=UPI0013223B64|nr:hypothetical protein [Lentibacillus sp. JNUCC-1]